MQSAVVTEKAQAAKSLLLRQSIFLLGLSMIAVLWIGLGWKLQAERAATDQRLTSDTANLARAFEESVLRTMQQVDLRLQVIRRQIAQSPDPATWHRLIGAVPLDDEISFQLALTDAKGHMVTSTLDLQPARPVDLSDREHVRTHLRSQADDLFVSKPLLGRVSKQWSVNISRAVRNQDGQLVGVAVASLSPAVFTRFYDRISLGARSSILLFGVDGHVRASTGNFDLASPGIHDTPFFKSLGGNIEGRYQGPLLDSEQAVSAWRKVRNMPLYVVVAIDRSSARAAQSYTELIEMIAAAIITLMIATATTLIVRSQHRIYIARQELQATARQVEEKSQELETMLDTISQGIVMVDREGGLLVANRRALELLETSSFEALARGIGALLADVNRMAPGLGRLDTRTTIRVDLEISKDRILEVSRSSMADGNVVLTLTDVTLVKRRQTELEVAWHAADAANRAKSQFLSTMSHEMRTPLNGMIGALDLLAQTKLDREQKQFVETALQSGEALLVHINDVLDFSKMEAGKLVLEPAPFNLRHLVDSVLKIVTPQAEARSNVLVGDIAPDLPAYLVGDPIRVRQILLNLVGNATKFTRNGRVTVRMRTVGGSHERPEVLVSIEDTGLGIPADRIEHLFQEFSMVDASLTRKQGGTGLGLAICKRLVEAMGGEIGVESQVGQGSRFWFRVAFARAEEPSVEEKVAEQVEVTDARSLDILLVDDNLTNQMVASRMLVAAGHLVTTASDGLEALQAATKKRYDVILMDVSMPEMDGIEATKRIRQLHEPHRSVPIIALTANAIAGDRERFLAAGMDDYLTKPIRRATIEARLARFAGDLTKASAAQSSPVSKSGEDTEPAIVDAGELDRLAAETSPDIIPLVIEQFASEAAVRLKEVLEATAANDVDALRKAAHALAGASASVGGIRLRARAKEIEQACAEGRGPVAIAKVEELPSLVLKTTTELQAVAAGSSQGKRVSAAA